MLSSTKAIAFRNERDWAQFHNAKDLGLWLSFESSPSTEPSSHQPALAEGWEGFSREARAAEAKRSPGQPGPAPRGDRPK